MLELWNDGFKKNKTQSANYCIAFVVLMEYFRAKTENNCLVLIIQNVDPTFFVESAVFRFPYPLFQHSTIPSFHAAYQQGDRKSTVIPIDYIISETFNYHLKR
jgi:hypothetical protein